MSPRIVTPTENTWIACAAEGYPLGYAALLPEVDIQVHPAARRQGVGTLLLNTAAEAARALGRRSVVSAVVEAGSAGDAFLSARGLRKVLSLTYTRLDLTTTTAPPAPPVPGYRVVAWTGTVPDELANSFAASRRAMDDMPMDDADVEPEQWDVDRVRRVAAIVAERGDLLDTVAAVDEATGEIAGFTEVVVPGSGTGDGQNYGTGVLIEHRGRGLARLLKAVSISRAREQHPALAGLLADTADSNAAMRRLNDSLGYRPTHQSFMYQLDL